MATPLTRCLLRLRTVVDSLMKTVNFLTHDTEQVLVPGIETRPSSKVLPSGLFVACASGSARSCQPSAAILQACRLCIHMTGICSNTELRTTGVAFSGDRTCTTIPTLLFHAPRSALRTSWGEQDPFVPASA